MSDKNKAERGLEIATEAASLLAVLGQLTQAALAANDPSVLRRVRDVIDGDLEIERVLRGGEEKARLHTAHRVD